MTFRGLLERIMSFLKIHAPTRLRKRWVRNLDSPEIYDRLYADPQALGQYLEPNRLAFYREVSAFCQSLKPRRVLEVGCGPGGLLAEMDSAAESVCALYGIDQCLPGLAVAKRLCPRARLARGDLYQLCFQDGSFDLVICMQTLEHLERPRRALEEMVRLCAPGGALVITIPDGRQDRWEGHLNFWSEEAFKAFCGRGFVAECRRLNNNRNLLFRLTPHQDTLARGRG
jgi:SAM-dependent methyltransferase